MNRLRISNVPSICHRPNDCRSIFCLVATALTTSALVLTLLTTEMYINQITKTVTITYMALARATSAIGGVALIVIMSLLMLLLYKMLITKSKPLADIAILAAFATVLIFLINAAICSILTLHVEYESLTIIMYMSFIVTVTYLLLLTLVVALSLRALYKQTKQVNNDHTIDLEAGVAISVASTTPQQS